MPDFAVRVRGAKGRSWRSPRRLVAVYLGLWVFALVVFLLMDPTDAMGYALLFHWLLLPIAAFVISLRIGELVRRDGRMWLLPLALGLLYMLADFLTFRLANMLAFDKINLPQWDLFFIGAAISAPGPSHRAIAGPPEIQTCLIDGVSHCPVLTRRHKITKERSISSALFLSRFIPRNIGRGTDGSVPPWGAQ